MNSAQKNLSPEHQEVTMLLPWYVNKTLHKNESLLVENHLKSCLVCKIELANLQKFSASICQEDLLVPVAHASFLQLKNRIYKNTLPSSPKTGFFENLLDFRLYFSNLSSNNFVSLKALFILASFLFLTFSLISPVFFAAKQNSANTFHTLSSSVNITHQQNEVRLVFSNETTQEQIKQILTSVEGQIVAGPDPLGIFRVHIGKGEISSKNLIKTISILRKNKQVIFAEPTFSSSSATNQSSG